jgi:hypothetical protein
MQLLPGGHVEKLFRVSGRPAMKALPQPGALAAIFMRRSPKPLHPPVLLDPGHETGGLGAVVQPLDDRDAPGRVTKGRHDVIARSLIGILLACSKPCANELQRIAFAISLIDCTGAYARLQVT